MNSSDFKTIAKLHRKGIPFGFLSSLGENFLTRLYYGISKAPGSCVIVERDEKGEVIGFISASLSIGRCYRYVLTHNFISLGFSLLPILISILNIKRIFETIKYPFKKGKDNTGSSIEAELLSIAVADSARGKGVGKRLIKELEKFFIGQGHEGMYKVVTYAADPVSNAFYLGAGFTFSRNFVHHNNPMKEYVKVLSRVHDR